MSNSIIDRVTMTSLSIFSVAAAMLCVYIVQCERDKITGVLTYMLTAAFGTTKKE